MPAFADTNVLIYAFDTGSRSIPARAIIDDGVVLSVQSLNEFANVSRRKLGYGWDEIERSLDALIAAAVTVMNVDMQMHRTGLRVAQRYHVALYDAMIVAAALISGCETLYSEDLHDGLLIEDRLRVVNPFVVR